MDYYIGIDIGTGGVRTGIFDREGKSVIFCAEPISSASPIPDGPSRTRTSGGAPCAHHAGELYRKAALLRLSSRGSALTQRAAR